jgi:hypothetical protein
VLQYGHREESNSSSASVSDSDEDVFSRSLAAACDIGMYFFVCVRDALHQKLEREGCEGIPAGVVRGHPVCTLPTLCREVLQLCSCLKSGA